MLIIAHVVTGCFDWPDHGVDNLECEAEPAGPRVGTDTDSGTRDTATTTAADTDTQTGTGIDWAAHCIPDTDTHTDTAPAPRIVVIGDVHGSLEAVLALMREAGIIDDTDHWIGGDTVLVQLGDQIDRGDHDRAVIDLFERLKDEARDAGGRVINIIGNHETGNVNWNFSHATDAGLAEFDDIEYDTEDTDIMALPEAQRGRAAAFQPGGPYARILAERSVVAVVDGNVFSHAGMTPDYVEYGMYRINQETQEWLRGDADEPDHAKITSWFAPLWNRYYGYTKAELVDCDMLHQSLGMMCADRMIVGHTIQESINGICDDSLYRIDVGMYEGEHAAALEIVGDDVRVIAIDLTEAPLPSSPTSTNTTK